MSAMQFISFGMSVACLVIAMYHHIVSEKHENVPYWMGLAIINLVAAKF